MSLPVIAAARSSSRGIGPSEYAGIGLWVATLGPDFITALLLFVSGIPLLEKAADKKHGDKLEYKANKARMSVFILLPSRKT